MSARASIPIDGHEHTVLLLLCRRATPLTWPGTAPATLHDPRQAERYPCFTVLTAASLIEAEDAGDGASWFCCLASEAGTVQEDAPSAGLLAKCPPPLFALAIEAEWRKRAAGVVPAQPRARPEGQRHSLTLRPA